MAKQNDVMTEQEKALVTESWNAFTTHGDLTELGIPMYLKLFADNPELKPMFSFMSKGDFTTDHPKFRRHVKGVFEFIATAVSKIDDLEVITTALKELGAKHKKYGAQSAHLPPVGKALIFALEKELRNEFTDEVRDAWLSFYSVVSKYFAEGLEKLKAKAK